MVHGLRQVAVVLGKGGRMNRGSEVEARKGEAMVTSSTTPTTELLRERRPDALGIAMAAADLRSDLWEVERALRALADNAEQARVAARLNVAAHLTHKAASALAPSGIVPRPEPD